MTGTSGPTTGTPTATWLCCKAKKDKKAKKGKDGKIKVKVIPKDPLEFWFAQVRCH